MSVRTRHRIEFGIFGLSLALSLMVWRGIRAGGRPDEMPIHCYGGSLSSETRSALEGMNRDLHDAKDVLSIGSRDVFILDRSGRVREYSFDGSDLCVDRRPIVSGVNALYFEYRDQWGNLLTHRKENCVFVQTIAYTLRLQDHPSEVFVNSRTAVPYNRDHKQDSDQTRLASVQTGY
jgi:hypothetical protein